MENKIFICKEKVNYRLVVGGTGLFALGSLYSVIRRGSDLNGIIWRGIGCVVFAIFWWGLLYVMALKRNRIIRNGEVIWCKVDRSRSENNGFGIVIRAGYYWKKEKQFAEYVGSIRTWLNPKRDNYIEQSEKMQYVPVFVDKFERDKYTMGLCDLQFSYDDVHSQGKMKDVIRVIDKYVIEK